MDHREVEPQSQVDVSRPELRQARSGKTLNVPGTQEMLNRLLQLVLSQAPRRRNADLFSKLLEVVGVPITVVERRLRHGCRKPNSWRLYAYPSRFTPHCNRIYLESPNMFISKKHLTRRTVLRGAGTALALPLLDAMIPARTALAQTAAKATPHLGFIYFPHGAVMNRWTPTGTGPIGEFGDILKPLDKYKAMTTVFSNIDNPAAVGPVHALSPGTWLSCTRPAFSQEPHGGTTADQIAAQHIGQDTPMPSLEVATDNRGGGGFCDRDYGCSYAATISFRTPTTPLPMEIDPRKLFIRLFGQGDNASERARLSKQYASVLDMLGDEVNSLQKVVGPSDRAMLS